MLEGKLCQKRLLYSCLIRVELPVGLRPTEGHYCRLLLGPSRGRTHCMLFSVGVNLIEGDFLLLLRRRFPALSPALVGRPLPQQEGDSEARRPHFTHFPQRGVICGNTLLWHCLWMPCGAGRFHPRANFSTRARLWWWRCNTLHASVPRLFSGRAVRVYCTVPWDLAESAAASPGAAA